ncbi:putative pectate lyase [Helianthus debilis subsp. tardiflorus]
MKAGAGLQECVLSCTNLGLIQRMPRCRHRYFHVVNNDLRNVRCIRLVGVLTRRLIVRVTATLHRQMLILKR